MKMTFNGEGLCSSGEFGEIVVLACSGYLQKNSRYWLVGTK